MRKLRPAGCCDQHKVTQLGGCGAGFRPKGRGLVGSSSACAWWVTPGRAPQALRSQEPAPALLRARWSLTAAMLPAWKLKLRGSQAALVAKSGLYLSALLTPECPMIPFACCGVNASYPPQAWCLPTWLQGGSLGQSRHRQRQGWPLRGWLGGRDWALVQGRDVMLNPSQMSFQWSVV